MTETTAENYAEAAEFDFEAWISDARLPEGSETVYKRADLVAQIDLLARQIRVETDATAGEKTSGGSPLLKQLQAKRKKLMEAFARSEITFYIRALPNDKIREIAARHTTGPENSPDEQMLKRIEMNRELLSASIVAMESPTLEKREISLPVPMIVALENGIGPAQLAKLLLKRQEVQNEAPQPDADFLPGASGTNRDSGR
ncbi:hypothetical protein [Glutamicibacter sp.]|uniref:hypothetical protein n=1 Tax=Glutamicibacter sp. TaxID=1931995 RepID=UPI0028BD3028|nr:hypothetical protein [Glutamicibacter sp.]